MKIIKCDNNNAIQTVLKCGGTDLVQVGIKREIFEGHSLSSLLFFQVTLPLLLMLRKMGARNIFANEMKPANHPLFMDDLNLYGASKDQLISLVQAARTFLQDIKMSFRLNECAVLEMRRGGQVGSRGIDSPGDQHIIGVEEGGRNYLGILQLNKILNARMKRQNNGRVCKEGKETMQIQSE